MSDLHTVSQIADLFGEPPQRVAYIIRKYRIKPRQRVGITRLFDEAQLPVIKQGLYGIRIHRDRGLAAPAEREVLNG
ncbi:hypothetical protein STSP2_02390 [Anaerohalosphaera lusitana]|uniref:HTH merR-type domain-containing protein n=1 Tax=Anaerohalosphaera lusitana TaxID=1936003 RepID=A0A1U9NMR3_9BACT|nr:hypothetical protein [Anaerohalosphaera lusitana]AQT69203.1 hypothetical protein STSP2_02390 [Anaerohalosphaera lusitana]